LALLAVTQTPPAEVLLSSVLLQLIVMIGAARLCHTLARRIGQPGVTGEIVAGLLLGPSCFGYIFPHAASALFDHAAAAPITIISQIGLILLMFQIGTDFAFGELRGPGRMKATIAIAIASITVPFCLGISFGRLSAAALAPRIDPVTYSLFCGVGVCITAVPILGRILRQFGLTEDPLGVIAISAAAVNDVVGWVLLACTAAYATDQFSLGFLAWKLAAIAAGIVVLQFVLFPLTKRLLARFPVLGNQLHPNLLAFACCLMFALGLYTKAIGIFTIFGGFAAGLLFHRQAAFVMAWRAQVGQFVTVFFLPVFFTFTGLRTNLLGLSSSDLGWLGLLLAISILGKMIPVYLAARLSGLTHVQSAILGSLMNTRALMELIVLNIGYDLGFLPKTTFTMLVVMAVGTTIMTGPLLNYLLPKLGFENRLEPASVAEVSGYFFEKK
jgi:Kef-type K+ transport system membrane component KefB